MLLETKASNYLLIVADHSGFVSALSALVGILEETAIIHTYFEFGLRMPDCSRVAILCGCSVTNSVLSEVSVS